MRHTAFRRIALLLCITLATAAGVGGVSAAEGEGFGAGDGVMRVTVYFVLSTENAFHLVPVGVEVPQSDKPAEKALEILIRGAPAGSPVRSLIPSDTRLLGYSLENGTATVNFSNEITRANVGSSGEALLLDSIMATLAQFPGVERIRILVDGAPLDTLAGHVDITGPLPVRDIRGTSLFRGFEDAQDHWAEGPITALYSAGVISGYPDGLFRPQGVVTRAEFVKMLVSSRRDIANGTQGGTDPAAGGDDGDSSATPGGGEFTDVADTEWYKPYVDEAVAAGIVAPADYGGVFSPNTPITRREVAVMLVRAANLEAEAVQNRGADLPFTDTIGQPDWAKGYLAVAFEHGLMVGDPDGAFRPHGRLTRAEAATVISRAMGLGGPNVFLIGPRAGETVTGRVAVAGVARVFEAAVCARVRQGGNVISQACTMASEGAPGWGFFAVLLDLPAGTDGDLTVEALTFSAKDGSEQDLVSRQVRGGR